MAARSPRGPAALIGVLVALIALVLAGCASGGSASGRPSSGGPSSGGPSSGGATTAPHQVAGTHTGTATMQPGTASRTVVRRFVPFASGGAPVAGVTARRPGSCFTASVVVSRTNSYRCLAHNELLDPCFAKSRQSSVLYCYAAPWSTATRLTLTRSLVSTVADPRPTHVNQPWAIRLANGARCVAVTGTVEVRRGVPLTYTCGRGAFAGFAGPVRPRRVALYAPRGAAPSRQAVTAEWVANS